jgi:hypothetical protein
MQKYYRKQVFVLFINDKDKIALKITPFNGTESKRVGS